MSKEIEIDPKDLECFDEKGRKVLVDTFKKVEALVDSKIKETMADSEQRFSDEISPREKFALEDSKRLNAFSKIWKSNGYVEGTSKRVDIDTLIKKDADLTKKLSMQDNFSTDHPLFLPRVISNIAREAIEPNLVLTPLLGRINYSAGTHLVFPSWGAMHASDIAEGAEYPERSLDLAGVSEATIGKSGIAIKLSEEMMRYSQFDVMSMHFRAAGRALARWKEKKVADLLTADYSNRIFDNASPSAALDVRTTTGRDAAGVYNGTLTLDDLFVAYAKMVNRGFTPNTLIMHPFAWQIFAQEGIARAFGFINGMNPLMWQAAQGAPGRADQWKAGGGSLSQTSYVSSPANIATSFTNVPSIFPTNFRIIISPFMPYTAATQVTDIVLCDSNELGVMIVDEEVRTEEWKDPARDILKVKFRERYGLTMINDGKGIGLMKSIKIGRSYDFSDKISLGYSTGNISLVTDTGYHTATV